MQGECIRLAQDFWRGVIPDTSNVAIKYVEIGVFCGFNLVSVGHTFGSHPDSKLYAIDPWSNYEGYNEFLETQDYNYRCYKNNIKVGNIEEKVVELRGFSHEIMPKFDDNFFDIVYVDGSHQYDFVVIDCKLAAQKVKSGAYIIVDDTNHPPIVKATEVVFNDPTSNIKFVADIQGCQRVFKKE
jgi:hypothetical protein